VLEKPQENLTSGDWFDVHGFAAYRMRPYNPIPSPSDSRVAGALAGGSNVNGSEKS
jgi:hypothetical protein